MNELFQGLDHVRTYIDNLLCITRGSFEDHLNKLDNILSKLKAAGLKVNAKNHYLLKPNWNTWDIGLPEKALNPSPRKFKLSYKSSNPKQRKNLEVLLD